MRAFWVILGLCGLFWAVGVFWADLRKILAGAPCCNGIHFELKLVLALLLVFVFFCLLWLACSCFLYLVLSSFALFWLAWDALPACAFRSNAIQVSPYVGSFFALVAHFFEFLTHLKLSCVFVTIFCDFGSIFRRFGKGLGRILGRFFDDFW